MKNWIKNLVAKRGNHAMAKLHEDGGEEASEQVAPTPRQAAERAVALKFVAVHAMTAPPLEPHPDGPAVRSYDDIVRMTARSAARHGDLVAIDEDFGVLGKAYRALSDEEWSSIRSITMERHCTLNWLCGHAPGNDWDATPTST